MASAQKQKKRVRIVEACAVASKLIFDADNCEQNEDINGAGIQGLKITKSEISSLLAKLIDSFSEPDFQAMLHERILKARNAECLSETINVPGRQALVINVQGEVAAIFGFMWGTSISTLIAPFAVEDDIARQLSLMDELLACAPNSSIKYIKLISGTNLASSPLRSCYKGLYDFVGFQRDDDTSCDSISLADACESISIADAVKSSAKFLRAQIDSSPCPRKMKMSDDYSFHLPQDNDGHDSFAQMLERQMTRIEQAKADFKSKVDIVTLHQKVPSCMKDFAMTLVSSPDSGVREMCQLNQISSEGTKLDVVVRICLHKYSKAIEKRRRRTAVYGTCDV